MPNPVLSREEAPLVFVTELLTKRQVPHVPPVCTSSLDSITRPALVQIAKGFSSLVVTCCDEEEACEALFKLYPAVREMAEVNPNFFNELLVLAGVRLLRESKRYALFRLFLGAFLSIFDTAMDIYMVFVFRSTGQHGFARATMVCVASNMALQLLIAFVQNREKGVSVVLREFAAVFLCIKPGLDSMRVALDEEMEEKSIMDAKTELAYTKAAGLFAESLPGALIQMLAFIAGTDQSLVVVLSLASSVITGAFISTFISYDLDVDKRRRKFRPDTYGYIPDGLWKRLGTFACMLLMSGTQLFTKAFSCALCAVVSTPLLVASIFGEVGLFLIYKLLRQDFLYWLPIPGVVGATIAFFIRIITKIIVDFTALVHFRNPHELGGIFFTFTLAVSPLTCLYFGHRYLAYVADPSNASKLTWVLSSSTVYRIIFGLFFLQISNFVMFLKLIKPKFRSSFLSFETSCQKTMSIFMDGRDDSTKILVFEDNHAKWAPIKDDVKVWLNDTLPKLLEEQPEWFNNQVKATIPDNFVDDPAVLKSIRGEAVKNLLEKRRKSIIEIQ